jgi:RimJ/RimL family protein N-acetyltransferase
MVRNNSATKFDYQIARLGYQDGKSLRAFFSALDRETNAQRFLSPLGEAAIDQYADRGINLDTVVYGAYANSDLVGIGELHLNLSSSPRTAELAIAINSRWQNKGIGRTLFRRTIVAAQNRSVKQIYMICLKSNKRMLRIALDESASLQTRIDLAEGTLDVPMAGLESLADEYACDLRRWNANFASCWQNMIT